MNITVTAGEQEIFRPMASERASQQAFFGVSALVFTASVAVTIGWCGSMSGMGEMPMPGGWSMSMAWMRMPEQSWLKAAASFLGMWVVMMVAMMMPCLIPTLWRYRRALASKGETHLGWLPALSRTVPIGVAAVVLIAGAFQFTRWKACHLACCREAPGRGSELPAEAGKAWRYGLHLGLHCGYCCVGLMTILLVLGVMDLRTMAVVTVAITAERLAPGGERVARAIGAVAVAGGFFMIVRAVGI